jgi:hypothetical protein
MMNNVLQVIKELKEKTKADHVVVGNHEGGDFIVAMQKGTFEQHNIMPLDTHNTVDSIADSFLQSYADQQELENDDE